jgi:hypothetical protein
MLAVSNKPASCMGDCYRILSGDEREALQFVADRLWFPPSETFQYHKQVIQAMLDDDDARGYQTPIVAKD